MPLMTMKEYARYRGVSQPSVSRAVKSGLCPVTLDASGQRVIDSDEADQMWPRTHVPNASGNNGRENKFTLEEEEKIAEIKAKASPLLQSRSIKEDFNARMAQLDYEERVGKLENAEKVRKDGYLAARVTRDNLLSLPDRVSAELAAISNPYEIHKRLDREIKKALSAIYDLLKKDEENA